MSKHVIQFALTTHVEDRLSVVACAGYSEQNLFDLISTGCTYIEDGRLMLRREPCDSYQGKVLLGIVRSYKRSEDADAWRVVDKGACHFNHSALSPEHPDFRPPVAEAVIDVELEFGIDMYGVPSEDVGAPIPMFDSEPAPGPALRRQCGTRDPNYKPHPGSLWMQQNWEKLPEEMWIAVNGDGIVAQHITSEGLYAALSALHVDLSTVVLHYNATDMLG